jgi:hypothetical protein
VPAPLQGAYYYHNDTMLGQGRAKALVFLEENPDIMAAIEHQTRTQLEAMKRRSSGVPLPPAPLADSVG